MAQQPSITLTDAQYQVLLSDYFAAPQERKRLSKDEVAAIASRLNERINIPILFSEEREQIILAKIVTRIDTFLYDNLPNEVYDIIRSLDEGIDENEAQTIVKRLSKMANRKIDIPYLPEPLEYLAINFLIGLIVKAMRRDWDIGKAIAAANEIAVPDREEGPWIFDTGE